MKGAYNRPPEKARKRGAAGVSMNTKKKRGGKRGIVHLPQEKAFPPPERREKKEKKTLLLVGSRGDEKG